MKTFPRNVFMVIAVAAVAATGSTFAFSSVQAEPSSMTEEVGGMYGHAILTLRGADGVIKDYRQTDNLIMNEAKSEIIDRMFGTSISSHGTGNYNFIAIGNSSASSTDATLNALQGDKGSGTTCDGFADTAVGSESTPASPTVTINAVFGGGTASGSPDLNNSGCTDSAIVEAGLFDSAGGDMFARQTFSGIEITAPDTLTVEWVLTFSSS